VRTRAGEKARRDQPGSSPREAVIALLQTADLVRRQTARIVEPHGITLQQYNVLRILDEAGDAGLPTLDVADRMIEQTPGITRLLDRLEAKGLIRRERRPRDRRQHLCWLTADGTRLLRGLSRRMMAAHDDTLRGLDPTERQAFVTLLAQLRNAHR
jgi:DNA-binding MarR family transcriptional regulator